MFFAFSLSRIVAFSFVLLSLSPALMARAATTADSVVSVIGWNGLAMWSGSGFVVGDGTWVVTCFHVAARKLANDRPLVPPRLLVVSPWTGDAVEAQVVRTDSDADLALLHMDGPPLPALALAPEDALDPDALSAHPPGRVRVSGFPHLEAASDPVVPLRVVSADTDVVTVVNREQLPSLVLAPTPGPQKGWSGGPATWVDGGAVVGVFFALVSRSEDPNHWYPHATPIQPLTSLLRQAGLDPAVLRHPTAVPAARPPDADPRFQHRMHAIIAAMDDRWDRMETEARALLKLTPDAANAHSLLAVALSGREQPAAALREWDEAVRRGPEHATYHAGRGEVLLELNRTEDAMAAFRRAAALAPDDADILMRLAGALDRDGRLVEAHHELERGVSLSPNHPMLRWALGNSWSRRGNLTAALREMAQAVELAADLPVGEDFRLGYAAELERAGHTDAAERQFRELRRREPESARALLALATHLADHGKPAEARSLLQKILANKPEPAIEKAARGLLRHLDRQAS